MYSIPVSTNFISGKVSSSRSRHDPAYLASKPPLYMRFCNHTVFQKQIFWRKKDEPLQHTGCVVDSANSSLPWDQIPSSLRNRGDISSYFVYRSNVLARIYVQIVRLARLITIREQFCCWGGGEVRRYFLKWQFCFLSNYTQHPPIAYHPLFGTRREFWVSWKRT